MPFISHYLHIHNTLAHGAIYAQSLVLLYQHMPAPTRLPLQLRLRTPLSLTRAMHFTPPLSPHVRIVHGTPPRPIACAASPMHPREHTQPLGAGPGSIAHPSLDATGADGNDMPHTPHPSSQSRLPSTLPPTACCSSRGNKSPRLHIQPQHVSMPQIKSDTHSVDLTWTEFYRVPPPVQP
jgi:hypothetical protein